MAENPLDPSADTERKIRERAYYMWEADGCPHGGEREYWERARELQAIADSRGAGEQPNPMNHPDAPGNTGIEEASIQENLGEFPHAGLLDQGDRVETPMKRRKATSVPKIGEKQIEDSPSKPVPMKSAGTKKAGGKNS